MGMDYKTVKNYFSKFFLDAIEDCEKQQKQFFEAVKNILK